MTPTHLSPDQLARILEAIVVAMLGVLQFVTPGCFSGVRTYFCGARAALSPDQRERLQRVLTIRSDAEGATETYTRLAGIVTIAVAPTALIPSVPYILPYAISCLAMAAAITLAYLHFKRATQRRVAPLSPRTPWTSLPPLVVVAIAICVLGTAAFATLPQFRAGAIAAIVAAVALCAIAWRVALAPAMLFGDDPQLEYIVDEHVRFCRATGLIALAAAPPLTLVVLAWAAMPVVPPLLQTIVLLVVVAFLTVMVVSLSPLRKRIRIA